MVKLLLNRLFQIGKGKNLQPEVDADFDNIKPFTNIYVCECGCPLFEGEKMCPDCLRDNPKFDGSY